MKTRLSLNEKLKDLRVNRHLTLEEVAAETALSKSALANYESDNYQDISPFALRTLADFYEVSIEYLLSDTDNLTNHNLAIDALHLTDPAIDVLKTDSLNKLLLSEFIAHPLFRRLLIDMEIYVDGLVAQRIQTLNTPLEYTRKKILEAHPGTDDVNMSTLIKGQIDENRYFEQVLTDDLSAILRDLKEAHKKDATSADKELSLEAEDIDALVADMQSGKGTMQEKQARLFLNTLGIDAKKLTDEEFVILMKILNKSKHVRSSKGRKTRGKKK